PVDSRVVGGLTFTWGGVTETTVDPSVVVPPQAGGSPTVDPFGRGVFNIRDGLVGAVVEYCGVDAFGLVQAVDRLHECVVVCVAAGADRRCDPFEFEVLGEAYRRELRPCVGMRNKLARFDGVAVTVSLP